MAINFFVPVIIITIISIIIVYRCIRYLFYCDGWIHAALIAVALGGLLLYIILMFATIYLFDNSKTYFSIDPDPRSHIEYNLYELEPEIYATITDKGLATVKINKNNSEETRLKFYFLEGDKLELGDEPKLIEEKRSITSETRWYITDEIYFYFKDSEIKGGLDVDYTLILPSEDAIELIT